MVKVRVLSAVVDGEGQGKVISIDEQSVKTLVAQGYVEVVGEDKPKQVARKVEGKGDEDIAVEVAKESAPKTPSKTRKTSNRKKSE